jgi:hypothetical protein
LATIAVVEKSGHKVFSLQNSFSTYFYLKTPNKHLYNIKKPIYQPKQLYIKKRVQKHQIKPGKNFLS